MNKKQTRGQIDWMITLLPLGIVVTLCVLFFFAPEQSNAVLGRIRFFFGDTLGTYSLVIGASSCCRSTSPRRNTARSCSASRAKSRNTHSLRGAA